VSKWKSEADLIVYVTDWESEAREKEGYWYYSDWEAEADWVIYISKWKNEADLIVYFTEWKSEAGWQK
jgi:hypothetical protein